MSDFVERSLPSHYSAESTLHALRIARREHPELAGLLALYEEVFALADEKGGALGDRIPLFIGRTHSLAEGIPWLHFEDLALEPHEFAEAARGIAAVLRRHRLEWADDALPADPARLLALAQTAVEGRRSLIGDDSGLAEASVELAVQRAMRSLAGRVTPHLDLENWRRGDCPFCGSPPVLSLLEPSVGARFLFCQRCHTSWSFPRTGCVFCNNNTSLTYHPTDSEAYRLYVCPVCQKYIKTVDLRKVPSAINPVVENLLTVGLDLSAAQSGYFRGT